MNSRNIPRDIFLGIYRGTHSSEYSEGILPRNIPRESFLGIFRGPSSSEIPHEVPRKVSSELPKIGPSENPSVYSEEISDELVVLGVSSEICFLGIPSEISEEKRISEELFPRTYFVGMSSE
ncbi:hypothetical protein DY000_02059268 [Brassica cretica]|uniref:Uncharacterized protein n=1 Tax=Brassica cretica TaxID=69181 RepID=A0ABQ7AXF6_BRACR|nr:hypothetical protein DY000_02059268 [Brassica cretica]